MRCECGRRFASNVNRSANCKRCGRLLQVSKSSHQRDTSHYWANFPICKACPNWGKRGGSAGCLLHPIKPCSIQDDLVNGSPCLDADDPRFDGQKFKRGGVGFIAVSYQETGGTEVWHQTLLPRLANVCGFVAVDHTGGDFEKLGCPHGKGMTQAAILAEASETIVVWGLGDRLGKILSNVRNKPRVISVSHCDHRSSWTREFMKAQEPWTDQAVHLCPSGIETIPHSLRMNAALIPNAADPSRCKSETNRESIRKSIGLQTNDIGLLVTSRISKEKRIHVLAAAMPYLPPDYKLIICGPRSSWCPRYFDSAASHPNVIMLDPVDHPGDLLNASDAVVSASTYEGYGLAMAEGILAGKPLIATQTGLLEDHPELARIVPLKSSPRVWAIKIAADFESGLQSIRAQNAKRWLEENHSVDHFVSGWEEIASSSDCNRNTSCVNA